MPHFIAEPIEVSFDHPPALEKKPGCPNTFTWRGEVYRIVEKLREWHDYKLRGKNETFYAKERGSFRAKAAGRHGTWGVGRDYFRVRVEGGRVFELYYDRAPKGSEARKGAWFLYREVAAGDESGG
jgi:hypothetical protein